jgi:hypothetical protein
MTDRVWGIVLALLLGVGVAAQPGPETVVQAVLDDFRDNPELLFEYVVLGQHPADLIDGGIVYLGMADIDTGERVEGLLELMVVVPDGVNWRAVRPSEIGFGAAFESLSETIRAGIDINAYKPQADPDLFPAEAYGLPYPHNNFGTVTRSYLVHGTGTIDFDLTGRDIAAAKDGTVIYVNDTHQTNGPWWYWNTVIVQHGEFEYTLYGHLAQGSVPDVIKATCTNDLSGPNCDYPIERGEVLGFEGNTGRSSNPHLHIEFGQALNFVALPDISDDDGDSNRDEPLWTPIIYREQNAAFAGYTPDAVAAWPWGRIEQAGHFLPVLGGNVVLNGAFDNGTSGWRPVGQLNWAVENGVLRATRLQTGEGLNFAAFYQFVNYSLYAGDTFEIALDLGNASGITKTARVELLNASGTQHGVFGCTFAIPANAPLSRYRVQGTVVNTWANALLRVGVDPADASPALLVDNVALQRVNELVVETVCDFG